ncbi:hypothetical protein QNI16_37470 [Cytophagaceae bacterium YF14B1]|uniref:Uncharacterized protein n=1 Tax=Xanthocytophaga flava TaxID=3048013 RepID=A0AAE3R0R9_9BACT|nr:hypothetical protein [Xanthocytophaga flavus]MDJ1486234.1 hypothetical protein [Xanthocytophaga flavus]
MTFFSNQYYQRNFKICLLSIVVFFSAYIEYAAYAQMRNDTLYIYPRLLVKVDTLHWDATQYATFLNSLNGIAQLRSKNNPATSLIIQPYSSITDTTQYKNCRCHPENYSTYPRYQKILQSSKLIVETDTFHLSVHQSTEGVVQFHIATCRTDLYSCMMRLSAVGPVQDSLFIKESLIQINKSISLTTPAKADALLGLPLSEEQHIRLGQQQLLLYDKAWNDHYLHESKMVREESRQYLIENIRQSHSTNYSPPGWTKLPVLENLSLDSLVRIRVRYYDLSYAGGPATMKLVPHFFPPGFTYSLYDQSRLRLIRGDFSMEDVVRLYHDEPLHPGNPFYFSKITHSTNHYDLLHFTAKAKTLLPKYNVVSVSIPSSNENRVFFRVITEKLPEKKQGEAYLIYTKEGNQYKRDFIPPLEAEKAEDYLEGLHRPAPYYVRELKARQSVYKNQIKRIYVLNQKKNSSTWISYPLPVLNDSSYTVKYQFEGTREDQLIINSPKWQKQYPWENPADYYKAREFADGDNAAAIRASQEMDNDKKLYEKLIRSVIPKDRLYTCVYQVEDLNGDGKKEIFSFSISNGKLLSYKCYTSTADGLVPLVGENIKSQIKSTKLCKEINARSLLATDIPK